MVSEPLLDGNDLVGIHASTFEGDHSRDLDETIDVWIVTYLPSTRVDEWAI